jgi:hypothetical protein
MVRRLANNPKERKNIMLRNLKQIACYIHQDLLG